MSRSIPPNLYPVILMQDRYAGTYSDGAWLAIANANECIDGTTRVNWALTSGPSDEDTEAAEFWFSPPDWISVGATPDEAIAGLITDLG